METSWSKGFPLKDSSNNGFCLVLTVVVAVVVDVVVVVLHVLQRFDREINFWVETTWVILWMFGSEEERNMMWAWKILNMIIFYIHQFVRNPLPAIGWTCELNTQYWFAWMIYIDKTLHHLSFWCVVWWPFLACCCHDSMWEQDAIVGRNQQFILLQPSDLNRTLPTMTQSQQIKIKYDPCCQSLVVRLNPFLSFEAPGDVFSHGKNKTNRRANEFSQKPI